MNTTSLHKKGFTLIELLVVISIISLFSSIIFAALGSAKTKGVDASKKETVNSVSTALYEYYLDNNQNVPTVAQDLVQYCEGDPSYISAMQQLVTAGYIPQIPTSSSGSKYCYMTFLSPTSPHFQGTIKALFGTRLDSSEPAVTGSTGGSCQRYSATGDANSDGFVDSTDLNILKAELGHQKNGGTWNDPVDSIVDTNNDGVLNSADSANELRKTNESLYYCAQANSQDYCTCIYYQTQSS